MTLLSKLRRRHPSSFADTFIVGFPGETDQHFEHLLQFVRHEFDLCRCLVFTGGGNRL